MCLKVLYWLTYCSSCTVDWSHLGSYCNWKVSEDTVEVTDFSWWGCLFYGWLFGVLHLELRYNLSADARNSWILPLLLVQNSPLALLILGFSFSHYKMGLPMLTYLLNRHSLFFNLIYLLIVKLWFHTRIQCIIVDAQNTTGVRGWFEQHVTYSLWCLSSLDDDTLSESKLQLELEKSNSLPVPSVSKRIVLGDAVCSLAGTADHASGIAELKGDKKDLFSKTPELGSEGPTELRHRSRGELPPEPAQRAPRHGLDQYISRFDEAMKLRNQLMSEKPSQENGNAGEEFDSFRIFRLVGCALLAFGVRAFVCKYLVSYKKRCFSVTRQNPA